MSRIVPALWAWAVDARLNTGSAAVTAKNAAAATRITGQPPDLHIPIFGLRPVCLSYAVPSRPLPVGVGWELTYSAPGHKARTRHPFLPGSASRRPKL